MIKEEREAAHRLWERLVVEFRASGQSGPRWCADRGYKLRQLRYWQHKLKTTDAPASGPQCDRQVAVLVSESLTRAH